VSAPTALCCYRGACHCGRVAFEVDAPAALHALTCNCSICRVTGFLHLIVPRSRFRLLRGEAALSEYRFNTRQARHLFCSSCGVKSFYVPRSHPEGYSVNVRCLEGVDLERVELELFDDCDREAATRRYRILTAES
jgi:hypothetical protein